uniref:Serine carboxypeptidase-like 19 n=1 Tax=Leersia perrieri TaxID=77586 RepID=A0A0D9VJM9_9ORYZ
MALKLKLLCVHADGSYHLSQLMLRPLACLALALLLPLPPPARAASTVVTHLPGFDGPLPFHLETGYVGVEEETGTELFYYFMESEGSPRTDPLLLWLSGGPRCSVFSGIVYEIGPIMFAMERYTYNGEVPRLEYNPYSWTKLASILFVDTPVGSGFSYAHDPKGYDVGDISSSMQVVKFLRKWLDDHPKYLFNSFYVGGDSYAGKVVPLITQYLSEGIEDMRHPIINLKGYLVGNPITGDKIDLNSRIPYSHSFGVISDQMYELISEEVNPLCPFEWPWPTPGRDASHRKSLAEEHYWLGGPPDEPPFSCFSGTVTEWIRCPEGLPYTYDLPSSINCHFNLTSRGYRALVYSGDQDPIVPFSGTQAWIRSLNFSIVDDWRAWHLDGQSAGAVAIVLPKIGLKNPSLWQNGGWMVNPFDVPLHTPRL